MVLIRALQHRGLLDTRRGRISVGWLMVEVFIMVMALVLLPVIAAASANESASPAQQIGTMLLTLGKATAFVVLMLVGGRRLTPWLMRHTAHTDSRELFRLAVYAIALGVAFGAYIRSAPRSRSAQSSQA